MAEWEIDQSKTQDHWLELVEKSNGRVYHRASAKWDGCIHYTAWSNEGEGDTICGPDYIHICDIDEEIDRLKRLKAAAVEFFKDHHYFNDSWGKTGPG